MFSRFALGDNACRWSNHRKSYEHSADTKPPAPHAGAGAELSPELGSERIIRRHSSPRFLKLMTSDTPDVVPRKPIKRSGADSQRMGTRVRARVPSDALSQPKQRDYGATWKSVRLASTPGTGGTRS